MSGRGRKAGTAASASAGNALLVTAYAGDTVDLTPVVTAVGSPDTSWSWNTGTYSNNLTVQSSGTAAFYVPYSAVPGNTYTFSVTCNGDNRLTVPITVTVVEPPPEEEEDLDVDWGDGSDSSDGEDGSGESSSGEGA